MQGLNCEAQITVTTWSDSGGSGRVGSGQPDENFLNMTFGSGFISMEE